jgi:ribosomal protein L18E
MTSTAATTNVNLSEQIEQLRKEAEEAKKAFNYELAFVLIDQADSLEKRF